MGRKNGWYYYLWRVKMGKMKKLTPFITIVFIVLLVGCSGEPGQLEITSEPGGAKIYINGEFKGTTPDRGGVSFKVKLKPGEYIVKLHKIVSRTEMVGKQKITGNAEYTDQKKLELVESTVQNIHLKLESDPASELTREFLTRVENAQKAEEELRKKIESEKRAKELAVRLEKQRKQQLEVKRKQQRRNKLIIDRDKVVHDVKSYLAKGSVLKGNRLSTFQKETYLPFEVTITGDFEVSDKLGTRDQFDQHFTLPAHYKWLEKTETLSPSSWGGEIKEYDGQFYGTIEVSEKIGHTNVVITMWYNVFEPRFKDWVARGAGTLWNGKTFQYNDRKHYKSGMFNLFKRNPQ